MRDLERMAVAHDFTWSDKELADMIRCFDSDGDGKVSNLPTSFSILIPVIITCELILQRQLILIGSCFISH